ncbi:aldehyde dehydrogenase family protein [Salipiger pallidus]|uniref:aldehyde dehydrogenase family protein n=1 Tax=Salipiger pallidus TaxID=1775170 RepID=UPI003570ACED
MPLLSSNGSPSGRDEPRPRRDQRLTVMRQPILGSAAIRPWNVPAAITTRKAALALVAGYPTILRPTS